MSLAHITDRCVNNLIIHSVGATLYWQLPLRPLSRVNTSGFVAGKSYHRLPVTKRVALHLHGKRVRTMRGYHCEMFDKHGDVIFPTVIIAESLDAAVQRAFHILHNSNDSSAFSSWIYGFKVWQEPVAPLPQEI